LKGIIFVVWEKYLDERFGSKFLQNYREALGEGPEALPMTGRVYPDELLVKGLSTASHMTLLSEDRLLVEYGRYFMINGLVEYLCGYLLAQSWNAYDLLLQMRDAHAQMRRTPDGLTPPLFNYEILSDDHRHMILTYESDRQLCSLLEGCIYGAAERFGEKAYVRQLSCLKTGDPVCRVEVRFEGESWAKRATPDMIARETQRLSKQGVSNLILQVLPHDHAGAVTLAGIKQSLDQHRGPYFPEIYKKQNHPPSLHISQIYTAILKLQQVGLVASTTNQPGDTFETRRYWRAPTTDN
jgi:Haem-NO-binding